MLPCALKSSCLFSRCLPGARGLPPPILRPGAVRSAAAPGPSASSGCARCRVLQRSEGCRTTSQNAAWPEGLSPSPVHTAWRARVTSGQGQTGAGEERPHHAVGDGSSGALRKPPLRGLAAQPCQRINLSRRCLACVGQRAHRPRCRGSTQGSP